MKPVQRLFDRLLLGIRESHLSQPPAVGTRFAALGFAPMSLSGDGEPLSIRAFHGECTCGRYEIAGRRRL